MSEPAPTYTTNHYLARLREEKAVVEEKIAKAERDLAAAKRAAAAKRLKVPDTAKNIDAMEAPLEDEVGHLEHRLSIWREALAILDRKIAEAPALEEAREAAEGPLREALADRDAAFVEAQELLKPLVEALLELREQNGACMDALRAYQTAYAKSPSDPAKAPSMIFKAIRWPDDLRHFLRGQWRKEGRYRYASQPLPFMQIELLDDESRPILATMPEPPDDFVP